MSNMWLRPLLACLFLLPDILCENGSFIAAIMGLERDCKDYPGRYTGRIYGHFWHPYKLVPPAVQIKPCVTLKVQYCQHNTIAKCNQDRVYWRYMCILWSVCSKEEFCPERFYCSCKKDSMCIHMGTVFAIGLATIMS